MRRGLIAALLLMCAAVTLADEDLDASFAKDVLIVQNGTNACHRFDVYLAITDAERSRGLMFVRELPDTTGMLFVYRRSEPVAMWMKNTFIPLDILFIGAGRRIVHIVERTVPLSTETIHSVKPALSVLELNAGTVSRLGIEPGDLVNSPALGGK